MATSFFSRTGTPPICRTKSCRSPRDCGRSARPCTSSGTRSARARWCPARGR
jgi:hypothetical protein